MDSSADKSIDNASSQVMSPNPTGTPDASSTSSVDRLAETRVELERQPIQGKGLVNLPVSQTQLAAAVLRTSNSPGTPLAISSPVQRSAANDPVQSSERLRLPGAQTYWERQQTDFAPPRALIYGQASTYTPASDVDPAS
ncbi:hypothetical protein PC129_g22434 [Phytophthora cactorum]|uniref:Uncharacterized protein n=1 Tax=Phytophthora cactorum TaxID=29920 RepID=A0A329RLU4_9STRA|nr:hypothetical protein Pcac1_g14549 [Phytophthora cactorum]KAG2794416.1 hypothetical protein PC111_g22608 [Phytophthora cactorum]KAG2794773.1 hypothetical protein PC112_g22908 [Phytophthora cactorum]KAG2819027.1 hypothetical protein PC113_g22789 [Phytophthora cactorum]KAG2874007.1 hypothetical protein PC114_g25534 [Phytophthora cactorum]